MATKVSDEMTVSIPSLTDTLSTVNTQVFGAGAILQVAYTETQDRQIISSHELAPITGLQTTITPRKANSKFLLQAMISNNAKYVSSYGFMRFINSSWTAIGGATTANANASNTIATTYDGNSTDSFMYNTYISHLHTPTYSLGQSLVFTAGACSSWLGTLYNLRINDRDTNDMGSMSSLTIFEIA